MSLLDKFIETDRTKTKKHVKKKHKDISNWNRKGGIVPGTIFGKISPRYFANEIQSNLETKATKLERMKTIQDEICYVKEQFHPYKGISSETLVLKPKQVFSGSSPSKEHREKFEREIEVSLGNDLLRKAQTAKLRRKQIIKAAYQQGIIGFDSPETGHSKYYKDSAKELSIKIQSKACHENKRRNLLSSKFNSYHLFRVDNSNKYSKPFLHKRRIVPNTKHYRTSSFKKIFENNNNKLHWTRKNQDCSPPTRTIEFISNTVKDYSISQVKSSPSSE